MLGYVALAAGQRCHLPGHKDRGDGLQLLVAVLACADPSLTNPKP